jgi:hypothetical protein
MKKKKKSNKKKGTEIKWLVERHKQKEKRPWNPRVYTK